MLLAQVPHLIVAQLYISMLFEQMIFLPLIMCSILQPSFSANHNWVSVAKLITSEMRECAKIFVWKSVA